MMFMVLATILQCSLLMGVPDNAADAWRTFFQEINANNLAIPQGKQTKWTKKEQATYEALAPWAKRAREIAMMPTCDWEINFSEGPGTMLPHLGSMREAVFLISFSIQGDEEAGRYGSALEGMHSILRISSQRGGDSSIIMGLVASSMFTLSESNVQLVDQVQSTEQLQGLLNSMQALDEFDPFGIRNSVGIEGEYMTQWLKSNPNTSEFGLGTEFELTEDGTDQYQQAMIRCAEIFQMKDQEASQKALELFNVEIEEGKFGILTTLLLPNFERLHEAAFNASERVAKMRLLFETKMKMLQEPNAATYALQAVKAYISIDAEERILAVRAQDFEVFNESFALLKKAGAMKPASITLANEASIPTWVAPLYCMTRDMLERGTLEDLVTATQIAGLLSNQERFAPSYAAANIIDAVVDRTPFFEENQRSQLFEAMQFIPFADPFMLSANAHRGLERINELYELEKPLKLQSEIILRVTLQLQEPTDQESFGRLMTSFGFLKIDEAVQAAIEEYMPDALQYINGNQIAFRQRLIGKTNTLKTLRKIARGDFEER